MSDQIRIKPAGKNLVRNPDANMRHLSADGELVMSSSYWRRRIAQGEVKVIEPDDKENK